jgi:bacteriorhodopsin
VSEGGNVIAPDSEAVFYGILDFLAKPVFGALLIWGHKDIDLARLGLNIRDYDGDALLHDDKKVCFAQRGVEAVANSI